MCSQKHEGEHIQEGIHAILLQDIYPEDEMMVED
jgi:hypothetical protein